jgi:transposase
MASPVDRYFQVGDSPEHGVMNPIDMRSLSSDERYARRMQVIGLRSAGITITEIASKTGLSRTGVFNICKRHDAAGPGALLDKPNGRKTGHGRLLLPAQERQVCALIAEKTPEQFGLPGQLWTPASVAQLIAKRLGVRLQRRAMRLYLARWGYVRHARMERFKARGAPDLQRWLDRDLPPIEARARLEAAEIHWAHEGALGGAAGEPALPVTVCMDEALIRTAGSPEVARVLSTVTNKGARSWMTLRGPLDAAACIDFLRRLINGRDHKVFLMLDRMQVVQAAEVAVWLTEHEESVEVFYLPGQYGVQV